MELHPDIYREILESLPIGVYIVDRDRRIVFWNDGAERITGYLRQDIIGRRCQDGLLRHCDDTHTELCANQCPMAASMRDGKPHKSRLFLHHRKGELVSVDILVMPVRNEHGMVIGAVELFNEHDSGHAGNLQQGDPTDERTGLPNRESTMMHLRERLDLFARDGKPFALFYIAVDSIEAFRNAYGRAAVNKVLQAVARTLQGSVHPTDLVGQWNESGFLVLLACEPPGGLSRLAELLSTHIRMTDIRWWGDRLTISASIGATIAIPGDTHGSITGRLEAEVGARQQNGGNSIAIV